MSGDGMEKRAREWLAQQAWDPTHGPDLANLLRTVRREALEDAERELTQMAMVMEEMSDRARYEGACTIVARLRSLISKEQL